LSFFDDVEEPSTAPRSRRTAGAGRPPSRTGGQQPPSRQAIQVRRAVAAVALVIVIVLIALGVHSCQVSQRNSALKDYNNNVASVLAQSDQTGSQLFSELAGGNGTTNPTGLQYQINETLKSARSQLATARRFDVPSEMKGAQQNLVLALQMRADAIAGIAGQIQPALATSASKDAINAIASEMARFYASDVVYKGYTAPLIAGQLNAANIAVGGVNGQTIYSGQFLPSLSWLTPSFIATELRVPFATPSGGTGKPAPGIHGHAMNQVTVNGTVLSTASTNTLPASPPPTFVCTFTNDGQNAETNVVVKVSVSGTSVSGQTVVPQTTPNQQSTARVTLSSSPPAGSYTVSATVERVPGETVLTHNTLSFPVTFQ